jgi:hypothetical protein
MVTARIFPFKENSHGKTGNRTRDLMISSQKLRPLDHEAGPRVNEVFFYFMPGNSVQILNSDDHDLLCTGGGGVYS